MVAEEEKPFTSDLGAQGGGGTAEQTSSWIVGESQRYQGTLGLRIPIALHSICIPSYLQH